MTCPSELVRACPAVIDAETEEEVVDYLNIYGSAIELSTSGTTEDIPVTDEDGNEIVNPLDEESESEE